MLLCGCIQVHILSKRIVWLSMTLLRLLPINLVDKIAVLLGKLTYGDLSKFGLPRPNEGPFYVKAKTGRSATIDVGCVENIKKNIVKVPFHFPVIDSFIIIHFLVRDYNNDNVIFCRFFHL
jgi:indole-3-pyruvate monooxygenase